MRDSTYRLDRPCFGESYSDPKRRAEHAGHRNAYDCYLAIWDPPPLPWVKRVPQKRDRPFRGYGAGGWNRSWHLALGLRKESGDVQVHCNVGSGPGPFEWREKPVLNWRDEPGQHFCRRCVAEWTKEVYSVTVRVEGVRVTKGQLTKLLEAIPGTDLMPITIRPTNVEDRPALVAEITEEGPGEDATTSRFLIVGDGVVKI
jgi:hypothetical protein